MADMEAHLNIRGIPYVKQEVRLLRLHCSQCLQGLQSLGFGGKHVFLYLCLHLHPLAGLAAGVLSSGVLAGVLGCCFTLLGCNIDVPRVIALETAMPHDKVSSAMAERRSPGECATTILIDCVPATICLITGDGGRCACHPAVSP